MSDRPAEDSPEPRPRDVAVPPEVAVHVPPDDVVVRSLRAALKRIVLPSAVWRESEGSARIDGPGPGHGAVVALLFGLALAGCAPGDSGSEFASHDVDVGAPPETRVDDVVDVLHGVEVADPYRWLEDQESPETRTWIEAQNEHTDAVFAQLPGRERLTALASRLLEIDTQGTPTVRGDRYFFTKRSAEDDLSIVYYRDGLTGEDRILLDPHGMSEDHTTSVQRGDVSDDGSLMVYFVREGGVDETEMRVLEVDARADLPDVFPPTDTGARSSRPMGRACSTGSTGRVSRASSTTGWGRTPRRTSRSSARDTRRRISPSSSSPTTASMC